MAADVPTTRNRSHGHESVTGKYSRGTELKIRPIIMRFQKVLV